MTQLINHDDTMVIRWLHIYIVGEPLLAEQILNITVIQRQPIIINHMDTISKDSGVSGLRSNYFWLIYHLDCTTWVKAIEYLHVDTTKKLMEPWLIQHEIQC